MRFKISLLKNPKHLDLVGCVGWSNTEEIYSSGDDHVILKWNLVTKETSKLADLPIELYPTDLHLFPRGQLAGKKQGVEQLLLTSADGKFHLISKNGRIEKSVEAHKGAVLAGRWSYDGAGLLTVAAVICLSSDRETDYTLSGFEELNQSCCRSPCYLDCMEKLKTSQTCSQAGEDGQIKIWSRSGMLRSTVVQSGAPIYSATWSPDSTQVLYTSGAMLIIKHLTPNSKPNWWRAHDGLVLKVTWNPSNNLIISGGEDCRYKVWDSSGRPLYSSHIHDYPITSVSWSPSGDLFAVGSYNTLRLCDKKGWSYSLEKPNTGSILNIAWSSDGTQVAGACGNGHIIFAHIIERRLEWRHYEATVTGRKSISVRDVSNNAWEKLEFPDRVIKVELGYNHMVVVTPSQCHIYTTKNWNTPVIFDLREGSVCMLLLSQRHFLLVEKSSLNLYSYEGRLLCSPRWQGMQPETLNPAHVSISPDTIAVHDQADDKLIHLFEMGTGRSLVDLPPLKHLSGVAEVALNQAGPQSERQLIVVDKNRDIYLTNVKSSMRLRKLGSMIQSLCWNSEVNVLAAVQDTHLIVWNYPTVLFVDKQIMKKTVVLKDASEFGKSPVVVSFEGNQLGVRRVDGSLVNSGISPYPSVLHSYAASAQWDDALRLCRFVQDYTLWACLAAMATCAKHLSTAEEAYAAIDEIDKVAYLQHIKMIPEQAVQLAEMALFGGNVFDAESILLQNGLVFRAILVNIQLHKWNRALELAVKYKTHVDTVLFLRNNYLERFEKPETNDKFLRFKDEVKLDAEKITAKMEMELQRESERN